MPYIEVQARAQLDAGHRGPISAGELSYVITQLTRRWTGPKPDFAVLATACGVLLLTLVEFIWKVVRPYEDAKAALNGDVYGK